MSDEMRRYRVVAESQNDPQSFLIDLTNDNEAGNDDVTPTMAGEAAQVPVMIDLTQETTAPETGTSAEQFVHNFLLMLHAHRCRRMAGSGHSCTVPGCNRAIAVLAHMGTCSGTDLVVCEVDGCNLYSRIISHWKSCLNSDCTRCCQLKVKLQELNIRKRTDNRATIQTRDSVSNLLGISSARHPDDTTSSTAVATTSLDRQDVVVDHLNNVSPLANVSRDQGNSVPPLASVSRDHEQTTPSQTQGANQQPAVTGVMHIASRIPDDLAAVTSSNQNIFQNMTRRYLSVANSASNQIIHNNAVNQSIYEQTRAAVPNSRPMEDIINQPAAVGQTGSPPQVGQGRGPRLQADQGRGTQSQGPQSQVDQGRCPRSQVDQRSGPPSQVGLESGSPAHVAQGNFPWLPFPDVERALSYLQTDPRNTNDSSLDQTTFSSNNIMNSSAYQNVVPTVSQEIEIQANGPNSFQQQQNRNHDSLIDSLLDDRSQDLQSSVTIMNDTTFPPAYSGLNGNLYRQRSTPNEPPFQFGNEVDRDAQQTTRSENRFDIGTSAPSTQTYASDSVPPPAHAVRPFSRNMPPSPPHTLPTIHGHYAPISRHARPTPTLTSTSSIATETGSGRTETSSGRASPSPVAQSQLRRTFPRWCRHEHELRVHLTCLRSPNSNLPRTYDLAELRRLGIGMAFHEDGGRSRGNSVLFTDWERAEVDEYIHDVFPVLRNNPFHLCTTVGRSRRLQRLPFECRTGRQLREHFLAQNRRSVPHIYIRPDVTLTTEDLHRAMGRPLSPANSAYRSLLLPTSPASPSYDDYSEDETRHSPQITSRRTIHIDRSNVIKDMLTEFSDTGICECRVTVVLRNEEAEDAGGVFRDILSEFWYRLFDKYFEGENQAVPRIHCELPGSSWAAIGRILYTGYVQAKYVPLRLCRSALAFCLFGETDDFEIMLLDSFLEYLPRHERNVMKKALQISQFPAGFSEQFQDELIDILSKFDMRRLPTPDNVRELALRSAQISLLERPHFPLHQMKIGRLKNLDGFESQGEMDLLFNRMKPDGTKVAAMLRSVNEHEICFSYLKRAVETFSEDLVRRFLRFVTGSDVILGRKIQVDFVNMNGLERRFVAHTCGPSLDVPSTYTDYDDFRNELRAQLLSDHWEMEFA